MPSRYARTGEVWTVNSGRKRELEAIEKTGVGLFKTSRSRRFNHATQQKQGQTTRRVGGKIL